MTAVIDDRRARRNVVILVLAQAVLGAQIAMIFIIGGLVGQQISPIACLATLPISMIVGGSMLSAPWLSNLMQRRGRRFGFIVGAIGGLCGTAIAATGLLMDSFLLFILGSLVSGIYMAAQGFYRFAATDTASDAFRPRAISYVLAGGLAAAVIGPQLVKLTSDLFATPFLGTYLAAILINFFGMGLFLALDIPKVEADPTQPAGRSRRELWADPVVRTAILCATISYALMNLVMTATPLAVVGCGYGTGHAADVVSAHILAMFAPSFITGHLINRFGVRPIMTLGLALLALAGIAGLSGVTLDRFYLALVLLGLGWNFGFIGATTLLTGAIRPEERGVAQGFNDLIVFGGVTFASLISGGLMNCAGGSPETGWSFVNLATAPFVALALLAIFRLGRHQSLQQS